MGRAEADRRIVRLCQTFALLAVALGVWFRLTRLGSDPLWLDEAYSAFAADHGLAFIWRVVPRYETHPPLYYSLLAGWDGLFGERLLARRMLGFACGAGSMAALAACAATLGRLIGAGVRLRAQLIAFTTALAALQPLMIDMSRQVRPYPVMTLAYALATLALLRLCRATAAEAGLPRRWLLLLFAMQAVLLWLHSLGPLFALATGLALLVAVARRGLDGAVWLWLIWGEVAVLLLYAPALRILIDQAPTWVKSSWLEAAPRDVPAGLATIYFLRSVAGAVAGMLAAAIGLGLLLRRSAGRRPAIALLLLALVPIVASLTVSALIAPVFLERTLSPAAVPMLLLMASCLIAAVTHRRIMMALLLVFLLPAAQFDRQVAALPPTEDWTAAVAWLLPRLRPGDEVWAYPNEGALPFAYALRDAGGHVTLRSVPAPMPALGVNGRYPAGGRGAPALFAPDIARIAASPAAQGPPTIWLLGLGEELYDPQGRMLAALARSRDIADRFHRKPIDIIALRRRGSDPVAPSEQPQGAISDRAVPTNEAVAR